MTRRRQQRTLMMIFAICGVILGLAAAAKLSGVAAFEAVYDYIRDMSLILIAALAAYLAHIYQRRLVFLKSLREEWREIVDTKSILIAYCESQNGGVEDYLLAYGRISRAIDYMRIVYANVGETDDLIGLYPYEPLHDMRKALERLDPRVRPEIGPHDRALARDLIWDAFNALRESFLDEFDLEQPTNPILTPGSHREKRPGADLHGEVGVPPAVSSPIPAPGEHR